MAESGEMSHRTPAPLVLDANASENWRKFLMQFEIYLVAKGKDDKEDKLKVNTQRGALRDSLIRDSLIRDRIVGGVMSDELRGELLKKNRFYPANRA